MISLSCVDVVKPKFLKLLPLKSSIKSLVNTECFKLGDVAIVLCSDEYLLKVNQEFLNHDYYTDIITFDYCEAGVIHGDLIISLDRVKENSSIENVPYSEELNRVIFHGILHLCGYKDKSKSDIAEMRYKESYYLNLFVPRETIGE
jgi:probable rRNA maturation factor